jgi:hypothetical protein
VLAPLVGPHDRPGRAGAASTAPARFPFPEKGQEYVMSDDEYLQ